MQVRFRFAPLLTSCFALCGLSCEGEYRPPYPPRPAYLAEQLPRPSTSGASELVAEPVGVRTTHGGAYVDVLLNDPSECDKSKLGVASIARLASGVFSDGASVELTWARTGHAIPLHSYSQPGPNIMGTQSSWAAPPCQTLDDGRIVMRLMFNVDGSTFDGRDGHELTVRLLPWEWAHYGVAIDTSSRTFIALPAE